MNCKHLGHFILNWPVILLLMISTGNRTFGQERSSYKSPTDEIVSIDSVSVLPFTDNLQGIYARPLEAHLISLVEKMHRWNYTQATMTGPLHTPEELESSPDDVLKATQGMNVDAVFAVHVTKGPNGVTVHMSLLGTHDGKLFAQAVLKDYKQFNINDLKEKVQVLLAQIVNKIPYNGRVMSREGTRVTVNLGSRDGIQLNQLVSVIQVISINRHPKFNFLISSEKEIIGKIKILKIDETLSFGAVVSEREKGAVQRGAKVTGLDFVTYGGAGDLSLGPRAEDALGEREDSKLAFGKDPRAWRPVDAASIGQVGGRLGLSRFNGHSNMSGVGALDFASQYSPTLHLDGEIWISPEWSFHARIKQAIVNVNNPRPGSNPTDLSLSQSYYEALVGYAIRFGVQASAAFVEPVFGYFTYKLYADTSTPDALSTMQYSGLKLGIRGASPVTQDGLWGAGGEMAMAWKPSLKETPGTSGASNDNSVVQFGVFGYKRLTERLKAQANLDFEMYSSTFSGNGSRANNVSSTSHKYLTLTGGIYYMF